MFIYSSKIVLTYNLIINEQFNRFGYYYGSDEIEEGKMYGFKLFPFQQMGHNVQPEIEFVINIYNSNLGKLCIDEL